jgi:hypothetical protein
LFVSPLLFEGESEEKEFTDRFKPKHGFVLQVGLGSVTREMGCVSLSAPPPSFHDYNNALERIVVCTAAATDAGATLELQNFG